MIQASENGYVPIDEPGVSSGWRRVRVSGSLLRFLGASVSILAAIISWVIMAEKLQKVNQEYHKPFFITYWVHGFGYTVLYIVWQLWLLLPRNMPCTRAGEGVWQGKKSRQLIILSGILALVSFSSAYSWYYSLPRTNIPANTAIYQAACVWVFLFSICLLRERVTLLKLIAVGLSVAGVVLVAVFSSSGSCHSSQNTHTNSTTPVNSTWSPQEQPDHLLLLPPALGHIHRGGSCTERSTFPGYIALLYSVISYAVFEVGYKKWGSEEGDPASVANSLRFLGYLGIHTLIWLWPGFLILHYSGVETFQWPPYDIFILLVWNALLDIFFNAGLLICIALSSALFASVGTILVIPAAVLVDWLLQGFLLQVAAAVGVALIITGFIGFVVSEIVALKTKGKEGERRRKGGGHHLQSSVCSNKEGGLWEEEEEGERDCGEEERQSLLRSRRRKQRQRTILKYLF